MILQALGRHYEDLASQGRAARYGWGPAPVSFGLELGEDGTLVRLLSLKTEQARGKKTVLAPQSMTVPMPVKRTVGVQPNFLCDNAAYLLGLDAKGKPERALQCFQSAKALHLSLLENVDAPAARAVRAFFTHWDPLQAQTAPQLAEQLDELYKGGNLVFEFDGAFVHLDPAVGQAWQARYETAGEGKSQICLVTGQKSVPVALHPSIKGVPGAQSSGASLVSFNAPSLESYGHEQGENAPTSQYAAFAYGSALNALLSDQKHRLAIGDTTIVFWAEGGETGYQDIFQAALLGPDEARTVSDTDLKAAYRHFVQGLPYMMGGVSLSPGSHFYVLGISPNAARLSVRFFYQDTFGAFLDNTRRFQQELEIVRPARDIFEMLPLWKVLSETVNQKSTDRSPSPKLTGEALRAVLTGGRYPATLLSGVILRIRADRQITRGRAAILKAYYTRNTDNRCPKEVLTVELNDQSTYLPYVLGRLFAVLERVQSAANPGINATIRDKYFNSASASPAAIFPLLTKLSQSHLRKLAVNRRVYFEKQLTDLEGRIHETLPARLTLAEQGAFQLGYYHQVQKFYEVRLKEETSHE